MLREAFDYPTRNHGSRAVLGGGGLLFLAGILLTAAATIVDLSVPDWYALVPVVLALLCHLAVRGYYVRVLRETAADPASHPPPFAPWRGVLADGARAVFVAGVYLLPAAILFLVAAGGNVASALDNPQGMVNLYETTAGLATLFGLLYLIGMLYVLPAAVVTFAHEENVWAAFHLRTVVSGSLTEDYAVAWILSVLLHALLLPFALVLQVVVVGFVLQFFLGVVVRYLWGTGFGRGAGFELTTVEPVGRTPHESEGRASGADDVPDAATRGGVSPAENAVDDHPDTAEDESGFQWDR